MGSEARRRLMLDLRKLQRDSPESICASPVDGDIFHWRAAVLGPENTEWEGGIFTLSLAFPQDYPNKPPSAKFLTRVFHPNVYQDGTICLDILQNEWSPVFDVCVILTSIQVKFMAFKFQTFAVAADGPQPQESRQQGGGHPVHREQRRVYQKSQNIGCRQYRRRGAFAGQQPGGMSKFDELMFIAIQEFGSVEQILESFFSFLERYSDFYHTTLTEEELLKYGLVGSDVNKMGFKPNEMQNLVNRIMQKNLQVYRRRRQPYLSGGHTPPEAVEHSKATPQEPEGVTRDTSGSKSAKYAINPWNGAITEKYAWTQTFADLTLEIIPKSNTKLARENVKVLISANRLKITIDGDILIDGEFCHSVNASDSMWNIEDQSRLIISLEKHKELWWDCVIKGDDQIDTQNIESVKRFDQFTAPQQAQIIQLLQQQQNTK